MKRIAGFLIAAVAMFGADPSGRWNLTAQSPSGQDYKLGLTLKSEAGKWTGEMDSERGTVPVADLQVSGDSVSYKISVGANDYAIKLAISGDTVKGTFTGTNGATGPVTGSRAAASAAPAGSVAGTWKGTAKTSRGKEYNIRLLLREEQGKWTGNLASDEGEVGLANIKPAAAGVTFDIPLDEGTYQVKMTVAGSEAKGTFTGPGDVTGTLAVTR
ncbi:MAG: hypothetical protein NTY38_28855 [Acidobacteria bacterium]|nr:hypothetical protein [Acidobacteriota bacterium]